MSKKSLAQKRYEDRRSQEGWYRLKVWIPRELRKTVLSAVGKIIREYKNAKK